MYNQINKYLSIINTVNVFKTPLLYNSNNSRISTNQDKGQTFQLIVKSLYPLMFLQRRISFSLPIYIPNLISYIHLSSYFLFVQEKTLYFVSRKLQYRHLILYFYYKISFMIFTTRTQFSKGYFVVKTYVTLKEVFRISKTKIQLIHI